MTPDQEKERTRRIRACFQILWIALGISLALWGWFHSLRTLIVALWIVQGASQSSELDIVKDLRDQLKRLGL